MFAGLKQNLHWVENGSLWEMPAAGDWQENSDLDLKRYDAVDDDETSFNDTNFSDECIGAVFENCTVPEKCFPLFLGKRTSEYLITHAILFLLLSKKVSEIHNFSQLQLIQLVSIFRKDVFKTKITWKK